MAIPLQRCLDVAIEVARSAGAIVRTAFATPRCVSIVSDKSNALDLVTNTDKETEKYIVDALNAAFPEYSFLGEETAAQHYTLGPEPTWVVDPIDGTTNFVHRIPDICVSIGLAVGRRPVLGVIYNPVRDELYTACEGGGAFLNGAPIRVDAEGKTLSQCILSSNVGYGRDEIFIRHSLGTMENAMRRQVRSFRMYGSACLAMASVARGLTSCYYESGPHAWDVCAGAVIVREAGGVVMDMSGGELDLCSRCYLAAANPLIAKEVLDCIVHPIPNRPSAV